MAPPKHPHPSNDAERIIEHEYSIRRLTELAEIHGDQIETNANKARLTHEELLVLKTKVAVYSALGGVAGTTVVLLFKTFVIKSP